MDTRVARELRPTVWRSLTFGREVGRCAAAWLLWRRGTRNPPKKIQNGGVAQLASHRISPIAFKIIILKLSLAEATSYYFYILTYTDFARRL